MQCPYTTLHSFAAQEMNRRARATSNDRLCTRRMCASQHIYVLHVYIHTHTPLVHVEARSFMVSLSTFCFMLALAWIPTARVSQPKIHHVHTVWSTIPADAFIPTRPMQSRRPAWPMWRRSNPLIDLPKHIHDLYDGSNPLPVLLRSNYTHVAIVWQLSRSYTENLRDKNNINTPYY